MPIRSEETPHLRSTETVDAAKQHGQDSAEVFWASLLIERKVELEDAWRNALINKKQELQSGADKVKIGMKLESTDRNMQKAQVKAMREMAEKEFGIKLGGMKFDQAANGVEGDLTLD